MWFQRKRDERTLDQNCRVPRLGWVVTGRHAGPPSAPARGAGAELFPALHNPAVRVNAGYVSGAAATVLPAEMVLTYPVIGDLAVVKLRPTTPLAYQASKVGV